MRTWLNAFFRKLGTIYQDIFDKIICHVTKNDFTSLCLPLFEIAERCKNIMPLEKNFNRIQIRQIMRETKREYLCIIIYKHIKYINKKLKVSN